MKYCKFNSMRILFHYCREYSRIMKPNGYMGNTKDKASPQEVKNAVCVCSRNKFKYRTSETSKHVYLWFYTWS